MFNNLCLPERAAEPVQLALIESRAERRLKQVLTAQLLALKEGALGRGAPRSRRAAPRTNKQPGMCTVRSDGGMFTHSRPRKNTRRHATDVRKLPGRLPGVRSPGAEVSVLTCRRKGQNSGDASSKRVDRRADGRQGKFNAH